LKGEIFVDFVGPSRFQDRRRAEPHSANDCVCEHDGDGRKDQFPLKYQGCEFPDDEGKIAIEEHEYGPENDSEEDVEEEGG
jgi:hypothetical protein